MTRIIGPSGIEIDVDDCTASGLVDGGHARYVIDSAEETPDFETPDGQGVDDPEHIGTVEEKPKGNASLTEWAQYAADAGKDVASLSRDEIRALFKD